MPGCIDVGEVNMPWLPLTIEAPVAFWIYGTFQNCAWYYLHSDENLWLCSKHLGFTLHVMLLQFWTVYTSCISSSLCTELFI